VQIEKTMLQQFQPNGPMRWPAFSQKMPAMVGRRPKKAEAPHRLREIRLRCKVTLEALAEKLGTNPQTVQRQEIGQTELRVRDLSRFASALEVDAAEIVGYDALFRDHQKVDLLQVYDRMDADDRTKLVRMAEAMAPARAAPAEPENPQAPALRSSLTEQLLAARGDAPASPLDAPEIIAAVHLVAAAYRVTPERVRDVVAAGVDAEIAKSSQRVSPSERDQMIADAVILARNELAHGRGPAGASPAPRKAQHARR
jgi:transcriptional regulator with XRE-family HTH domain